MDLLILQCAQLAFWKVTEKIASWLKLKKSGEPALTRDAKYISVRRKPAPYDRITKGEDPRLDPSLGGRDPTNEMVFMRPSCLNLLTLRNGENNETRIFNTYCQRLV